MADKVWIGAAQAIAQITTVTYSAYTSGQTYRLIINGKTVSYVAVASTSTDVWNGLFNAWNASTVPEHVEAIATVSSGVVLTSRTPGTPFTVTASATGGITATVTPTLAATGPNDLMAAANWADGTAPVAADNLIFRDSAVSVLYNIEQTGINFGNVQIDASFTGTIGLPATNAAGSGGYPEYRPRRLKLGDGTNAYTLTIGQGTGQGSPRILIDGNAATVNTTVYATGNANSESKPVQIVNTDSSSVIAIYGGVVLLGTTSTAAAASLSIIERQDSSVKPLVEVQAGVTITAATLAGGQLDNWGTITSLVATQNGAVHNYGAIPTIKLSSGAKCYWNSASNLATKAHVYNAGLLDFSRNNVAKSVAAIDLYQGANLNDPLGVVTYTAGIVLVGCKVGDVTLDVGRARTLTIA